MIRKQKIKGTLICRLLLSKWMGLFHSWLDCFSIGIWAFIQNINFLSSVVFVYWCQFVTVFKCCNLHYTVISPSNCIRYCPYSLQKILHKHWVLISLEEIIQIWIIPSLPKILISGTYTRFIVENRDNIWCNKKEGLFWHYIFLKISYLGFFLI